MAKKTELYTISRHKATELMETLSAIARVEKEDIATRLLEHEQLIDFSNILDASQEDLTIYCTKTGQPITSYSATQYCHLVRIHGRERARKVFQMQALHRVIDHWLYTDDKALEILSKTDPHGYFVYSAAFILMPLQRQIKRNLRSKDAKLTEELYELEQRKSCWNNIQSVPISRIIEANEMMRRYLSIFRTEKCWSKTVFKFEPVELADIGSAKKPISVWIANIKDSMLRILADEIKRGRINPNPSYADIVNLKIHYEGYTAFRRQKHLGNISELDEVLIHLGDLCREQFNKGKTAVTIFAETGNFKPKKLGIKIQTADVSKPFKLQKTAKSEATATATEKPSLADLLKRK